MTKNPFRAVWRMISPSVDNDQLAAYARPHDPVDYQRPELEAPPLDHPATRAAAEAQGSD